MSRAGRYAPPETGDRVAPRDTGPARHPRTYPRWLPTVCVAVSVAGLGVSIYLTVAHLSSATILACSESGLVNCERVTTSAQSEFLGIPVAVLGLGWFLAIGALTSGLAWGSSRGLVGPARLLLAGAGMAFVLYLLYTELFTIGSVCLWCTVAHVLAFVLFVLVMVYGSVGGERHAPQHF